MRMKCYKPLLAPMAGAVLFLAGAQAKAAPATQADPVHTSTSAPSIETIGWRHCHYRWHGGCWAHRAWRHHYWRYY